MVQDPEEVGIQLAETEDATATREEIERGRDVMEVLRESFKIRFEENQQGIQHELLQTAYRDSRETNYTDDEPSEEVVVKLAQDYGKDALYEYIDFLLEDVTDETVEVRYSDMPDDNWFQFSDEIVDAVVNNR